MIAFIRGTVADLTENSVILEAGNIGYEIYMTGSAMGRSLYMGMEVKMCGKTLCSCMAF